MLAPRRGGAAADHGDGHAAAAPERWRREGQELQRRWGMEAEDAAGVHGVERALAGCGRDGICRRSAGGRGHRRRMDSLLKRGRRGQQILRIPPSIWIAINNHNPKFDI